MTDLAVTQSEPLLSKRRLAWAGLAALVGCAACSALPLLVLSSLGSGALTALSHVMLPGSEPIVGAAAFALALAIMAVRSRVQSRKACLTADGHSAPLASCACGPAGPPTARIFNSGTPRPDEPIACTASLGDQSAIQAHIDAYRAAFTHQVGGERFPGGFRWRFRAAPGVAEALKAIAQREHGCCRFLSFDLRLERDRLIWETRGDERAATFLEEFFQLPERLRAEPRAGHDLRALKRRAEEAGLVFTADGPPSADRGSTS